ncbi:MAG: transglutaminase N-terminal domain-containing protein, partial [Acidobacteriota bacterium]
MFYSIRHVTRFQYSSPVSESVMEVRMRPRSELQQQCLKFALHVTPRARVQFYRDYLGNTVHYFDVPGQHNRLAVIAEAVGEVEAPRDIPEAVPMAAWEALDAVRASGELYEFQTPSHFAQPSAELAKLVKELGVDRRENPLTLLRGLNEKLFGAFEYAPKVTRVDSPIDEALAKRKGVCQDLSHIMIALARELGIPCRYVSGYLYPRAGQDNLAMALATHSWVEAWIPGIGAQQQGLWVGFDPTSNCVCGDRHIRAAIGRDYADVPPTKGVYKGSAVSELSVAVRVQPTNAPADDREEMVLVPVGNSGSAPLADQHWEQME